ncbi:DUF6059 family protein [Actinoplanes sp. NPDC051411]|uniref:DUF6059 family protein n=1 Tax=Actinoplanes sp. NPDC051411 TaxID=3155522 RepID=UPI003448CC28
MTGWRAALRCCTRVVHHGLIHLGASTVGFDARAAIAAMQRPPLCGPPPDHPERLTPGVPMTQSEIQVWAQLY